MSTSVLSRLPSGLGRQDEAPNQALAQVAAANPQYSAELFPVLLRHLETCRPRDVPQHAERTLLAVNEQNRRAFVAVLEKRLDDLTTAQAARVKRL